MQWLCVLTGNIHTAFLLQEEELSGPRRKRTVLPISEAKVENGQWMVGESQC